MTISFLLIFMIIPFAGDIMQPWILAVLVSVCGLAAKPVLGRNKAVFARMRFHQEFAMLAAGVLSFGMAALCGFGVLEGERSGDVFLYLGIAALLFYVMRGQDAVRLSHFELIFYAGSMLLLFYFVSYAIAPSMLLVPEYVFYNKKLTSSLAVVIGMIALWGFCREPVRIRQIMYCVSGAVALLVIVFNHEPGMLLILLAGMYAFLLVIPANEEHMKRCLLMFFGAVFMLCNLSLIVNYTDLIRVDGLHYPLEVSVTAELLLSLFALYVLSLWDKLKEAGRLNKEGLQELQGRLRKLLPILGRLFLLCLLFGWIHLRVGLDNFMTLFLGEKWGTMKDGVIAAASVSLVVRMSGILRSFWTGNVLSLCYGAGGIAGLFIGASLVAWLIRRVWCSVKRQKNIRLVLVVCGTVLALSLATSAAMELLPFYAVWIYILICDLQPRISKKKSESNVECGKEGAN